MTPTPPTTNHTASMGQPHVATHTLTLEDAVPTTRALRETFSRYPTGVVAVCADVDGVPAAMVVTSFSTGISFDPPLVSMAVQNTSTTWPRLRSSNLLGLSVLASDQADAGMQLASRSLNRLAGLGLARCERDQALLIEGAAMWMEGRIHAEVPAGDHTIVLIELVALKLHETVEPLVYHAMGFRTLALPANRD